MTKLSTSGAIIGPPDDKEYAVDPVGVATIKPSDLYSDTLLPLTNTSDTSSLCDSPLVTTKSFNPYDTFSHHSFLKQP
jgi:hypothetical protein